VSGCSCFLGEEDVVVGDPEVLVDLADVRWQRSERR
jgi:hypothetical protein